MYTNPWGSVCPRCWRAPAQCSCAPVYGVAAIAPKGCVCPAGAEATCRRSDCGRKDMQVRVSTVAWPGHAFVQGTVTGQKLTVYNEAEENAHHSDPGKDAMDTATQWHTGFGPVRQRDPGDETD